MSTEHRNMHSYGLEGPTIGEDKELSETSSAVSLDDHHDGHISGGFKKHGRQDSLDFEARSYNMNREIGESEDEYHSSKRPKMHHSSIAIGRVNPPSALIIHRVLCNHRRAEGEDHQDHPQSTDYLDVPKLFANDTRGSPLRGTQPLSDFEEFLENHPETCLVVYKLYSCTAYHRLVKDSFETMAAGIDRKVFNRLRPWFFSLKHDGGPARAVSENIVIKSDTLQLAMSAVVDSDNQRLASWNAELDLTAPYDYFYHFRHILKKKSAEVLTPSELAELDVLLDYVDESYGATFDEVDAAFSTGYVHRAHFTKLFGPNELIITTQGEFPSAYIAERSSGIQGDVIDLKCWSWVFDGSFRKDHVNITIPWPEPGASRVPISSLAARPLRLDTSNLHQRLEKRGQEFWTCRNRRFVSYIAPTQTTYELQTVEQA
jgi:hypothetical protein